MTITGNPDGGSGANRALFSSSSEKRVNFPSDVEFHDDIRLLVYRPHGLLDEVSVNRIVKIVGDLEARLNEPFDRFFDTLGHDEVELNFRHVIQISLHRVLSYLDRPPVKSAILATDSTIAHYCQLHAIITEDSPINVRIFQEREEAAKWLGVPLERVAPRAPDQRKTGRNSRGGLE